MTSGIKYWGPVALTSLVGCYALGNTFLSDNNPPCVELRTKQATLEIKVSDLASSCSTNQVHREGDMTIDTQTTYSTQRGASYSNIQRIELIIDGKEKTEIILDPPGPETRSEINPNLSYGKHTIVVKAYDTAQNEGQSSLEVFAYTDTLAASTRLEQDTIAPEWENNGYRKTWKTGKIFDRESGIQRLTVTKKGNATPLTSLAFQEYRTSIDLEDALKGIDGERGKTYLLEVRDNNGNSFTKELARDELKIEKGGIGGP